MWQYVCLPEIVPMDVYEIIKAAEEDLQSVHDMAEVVFRHTYREILSPEQMEYMMDWMYSMPNLCRQLEEGHVYYIAFRDGMPCGYVSVQREDRMDDGRMIFHLHKIYVLPAEQGNGLGRILFGQAVRHVVDAAEGVPARIELNVNRNNPSVGFYNHLGMRILRQGDFHIGKGFYMNDYIMGLDLN